MKPAVVILAAIVAAAATAVAGSAAAQGGPVYRCPGNPESYTNLLSAQEAKDRGCRTIEGAPITVVNPPSARPRAVAQAQAASTAAPAAAPNAATPALAQRERLDPAEQRARDTDARRILTEELRREEERLAALQKEFNNGEPERRGDERNYQRYLDRVAEMRAQIARKEADLAALRREIAKLPGEPPR